MMSAWMTWVERHSKRLVILLTLVFVGLEIPFSLRWLKAQGGFWGTHFNFWHQVFHDPLYQVTIIDFGTCAFLIFLWMLWDSWRQDHPIRPWLWLPLFLVSPSVGLLGYLLTRLSHKPPMSKNGNDG